MLCPLYILYYQYYNILSVLYYISAFKVQNPVEQLYGWESFCNQEIFLVYAKNKFKVSPNSNPLLNTIVGHKF